MITAGELKREIDAAFHKAIANARRQTIKLDLGWKRDQDQAAPWWKRITG